MKTIDSKNYVLEQNKTFLGKFTYDSSFSSNKATIQMENEPTCRIENESAWKSDFITKQNDTPLFRSKMNWHSNMIVSTLKEKEKKSYTLKSKGFWGCTHALLDQNSNELLEIKQEYQWRKFNYDYAITSSETFEALNHKTPLLFSTLQGLKIKTVYIAIFIVLIGVMVSSN